MYFTYDYKYVYPFDFQCKVQYMCTTYDSEQIYFPELTWCSMQLLHIMVIMVIMVMARFLVSRDDSQHR